MVVFWEVQCFPKAGGSRDDSRLFLFRAGWVGAFGAGRVGRLARVGTPLFCLFYEQNCAQMYQYCK